MDTIDDEETSSAAPPEIRRYASIIRQLGKLVHPNKVEQERLALARLKIAIWACEQENIVANRENLKGVLGTDAAESLALYPKLNSKGELQIPSLELKSFDVFPYQVSS